jgi:hypothetical protein
MDEFMEGRLDWSELKNKDFNKYIVAFFNEKGIKTERGKDFTPRLLREFLKSLKSHKAEILEFLDDNGIIEPIDQTDFSFSEVEFKQETPARRSNDQDQKRHLRELYINQSKGNGRQFYKDYYQRHIDNFNDLEPIIDFKKDRF